MKNVLLILTMFVLASCGSSGGSGGSGGGTQYGFAPGEGTLQDLDGYEMLEGLYNGECFISGVSQGACAVQVYVQPNNDIVILNQGAIYDPMGVTLTYSNLWIDYLPGVQPYILQFVDSNKSGTGVYAQDVLFEHDTTVGGVQVNTLDITAGNIRFEGELPL